MSRISSLSLRHTVALSLSMLMFVGCASKNDVQENPLQEPTSEAALLDEAEKSLNADSEVFADLQAATEPSEAPMLSSDTTEAQESASNTDESPFYDTIGGESLGRVAYTLYGERALSNLLRKMNPGIADVKSLSVGEKIYFDFERVAPQPTYLTKGLIDRYAPQLAERLEQKASREGITKISVVLERGETLQKLSQRLYGTTRYWTEIFLLNRDKITSYDSVKAGADLVVYQRAAVAAVPSTTEKIPEAPVAPAEMPAAEPVMPEMAAVAPPEETTASPEPVVDPIPETTPASEMAPASTSTPSTPDEPKPVAETQHEPKELLTTGANSTNVRRIIYVALILSIAVVAFYMTRPSKKQKFDMLDVTAGEVAARQKLSKDTQSKDVG